MLSSTPAAHSSDSRGAAGALPPATAADSNSEAEAKSAEAKSADAEAKAQPAPAHKLEVEMTAIDQVERESVADAAQ